MSFLKNLDRPLVYYDVTTRFNKDELSEFRESFELFDVNKDGYITMEELRGMMEWLDQKCTEIELQRIMKAADLDKNGKIDFNEFVIIMDKFCPENFEDQLREAFRVIDNDNSGKISSDEIKKILRHLGEKKMSSEVAEMIIREMDMDGDGQVDYEEFVKMFTTKTSY